MKNRYRKIFWFLFSPLFLLPVLTTGVFPQRSSDEPVHELRSILSDRSIPSFRVRLRLPRALLDHETDETFRTQLVFDGRSKVHLSWLRMHYNDKETLILQNREQLISDDVHRTYRWWIRGSKSAAVRSGNRAPAEQYDFGGTTETDRLRRLISMFFQLQLLHKMNPPDNVTVRRSGDQFQFHFPDTDVVKTVDRTVVSVDSASGRLTGITVHDRRTIPYFASEPRVYSLRAGEYRADSGLPEELRYTGADGVERTIQLTYRMASDRTSVWQEPGWYEPDFETSLTEGTCPDNLFQLSEEASLFSSSFHEKRLDLFQNRVDRIRTCYEQRRGNGDVRLTEQDLFESIEYATRPDYVPSAGQARHGRATPFQTLLRMFRLVEQGNLTAEQLQGISIRSMYTLPVQLIAFRSSIASKNSTKAFSGPLQRVSERYDTREVRLFIRELEHRLRGKEKKTGVIHEQGKDFLVSLQEDMPSSIAARLLMSRLYLQLGYFEKADSSYRPLLRHPQFLPEVKTFIDTAGMDATKCIQALSIDQLDTKDLLILAGIQAENNKIKAARSTFRTFVNRYQSSKDTSMFLDDYRIVRIVLANLLKKKNDLEKVPRTFFRVLVAREGRLALERKYVRSLIERVFGPVPSDRYMLLRHVTQPEDLSPMLKLQTAVTICRSRIESGRADRIDYRFLAQAIPLLSAENDARVQTWIRLLKKGTEQFTTDQIIAERLGDLHLRTDDLKEAWKRYQQAVKIRTTQQPQTEEMKKAEKVLNDYGKRARKRSTWEEAIRDPGVMANFQLQYVAWGLYFLEKPRAAGKHLREGARREREQGSYPYGSFPKSASHGLVQLHLSRNATSKSLSALRRNAGAERRQDSFNYSHSATDHYVRLLLKNDRTEEAISALKEACRAEWLQMVEFTFEDSASEKLVNVLLDKQNVDRALSVMNISFYRSLVETPDLNEGTAPHKFIQMLKEHRSAADALVVAREAAKAYVSDPEPLRREIKSLQSAVEQMELVPYFVRRFDDVQNREARKAANDLLQRQENEGDRKERNGTGISNQLAELDPDVIPFLNRRREETSSNELKRQLNAAIRELGWKQLRRIYSRPDFTQPFRE